MAFSIHAVHDWSVATSKDVARGTIRRLGQILASATFNPLTREADYQSNMRAPNGLPSLEELIGLGYSRAITPQQLAGYAAAYGAQLGNAPTTIQSQTLGIDIQISRDRWQLWRAVYDNNKPHYSLELLRKLARQGVGGAPYLLQQALKQEGFPSQANQSLFLDEWENLSENAILNLWFLGYFNLADVNREMAKLGWRNEEVQRILQSVQETYSWQNALSLWQYGKLGEQDVTNAMFAAGFTDPTTQENMKLSRFALPSVGELYLTGTRNSWDAGLASFWRLDEEKPDSMKVWDHRLGLDFAAGTGTFQEAQPGTLSWADVAWRNHWELPSLSLLLQIEHRVRGNPDDPATWSKPGYKPLTQKQIWDSMGQLGISPTMRNYIAATAYAPISMRHLRMIVKQNNPPLDWVIGVYRDNGYSPADAPIVAQALIADVHDKDNAEVLALNKRAWGKFVGAIEDSYSLGILDHATATTQLLGNGIPAATVAIMLGTADAKVAQGIIRKVIDRARSDLFNGRTTLAGALQRLIMAGIEPARAQQTAASWQAEFGEGKRQLATQKVLSLLRKGLLSKDQAVTRLDNLGWSRPDEVLLLAEVQQEVNKDRASALKAADAQRAKQQSAMEKALKKTAATATALQKRLKALSPPKEIVQWYVDGKWTEKQAVERLRLIGYPDADIQAMLIEGLDKKKSPPAKKG